MINNGCSMLVFGSEAIKLGTASHLNKDLTFIEIDNLDQDIGLNSCVITPNHSSVIVHLANKDAGDRETITLPLDTVVDSFGIIETPNVLFRSTNFNQTPLYLFANYGDKAIKYIFLFAVSNQLVYVRTREFELRNAQLSVETVVKLLNEPDLMESELRYSLNNHDTLYKRLKPEAEFEYKINLPPDTNIYQLHRFFYKLVESKELEGYVINRQWGVKRWYYENYLFEILEGGNSTGYVSFIRKPNSSFIVKHKIFGKDQYERIELRKGNVQIEDGFEDYLNEHFSNCTFTSYPMFTRILYNMLIDSLDTGHNFAVVFDRCSIQGNDVPDLVQCEVEYYNSLTRVNRPEDFKESLVGFCDYIVSCIEKLGIPCVKTFYSKLSYLKDNTALVKGDLS